MSRYTARPRVAMLDVWDEAVSGVTQRPTRTASTAIGTVLGVAAFVAIVGLTATAGNQISERFTRLAATEVVVRDAAFAAPETPGVVSFPDDADDRVTRIRGVVAGGVTWVVGDSATSTIRSGLVTAQPGTLRVQPASAGYLTAVEPTMAEGLLYDRYHEDNAVAVAVVGAAAARELRIPPLATQPTILINDRAYSVVGVIADSRRRPDLAFALLIPTRTALSAGLGPVPGSPPEMLISTDVGAAKIVAAQVPLALRPDRTDAFAVIPPTDPTLLREEVTDDVSGLLLALAGVCLLIGAFGIANTAMIGVVERTPEIGLKRALGSTRQDIALQFLVEGVVVGGLAGVVGAALGVIAVVLIALIQGSTAVMSPALAVLAPGVGVLVGLLASVYPALRAARVEPVDALRR